MKTKKKERSRRRKEGRQEERERGKERKQGRKGGKEREQIDFTYLLRPTKCWMSTGKTVKTK